MSYHGTDKPLKPQDSKAPRSRLEVASLLAQDIPLDLIAKRKGPGNQDLYYAPAGKIIDMANDIFGFDGWASSVIDVTLDYIDEAGNGRINVGVSAIVRVTLKCGNFHEDIGYGLGAGNNKGETLEKAKKESVTDALKRALRHFGRHLGGSIYDTRFLEDAKRHSENPHSFSSQPQPIPHRPALTSISSPPQPPRMPFPNVGHNQSSNPYTPKPMGVGSGFSSPTPSNSNVPVPISSGPIASTPSSAMSGSSLYGNRVRPAPGSAAASTVSPQSTPQPSPAQPRSQGAAGVTIEEVISQPSSSTSDVSVGNDESGNELGSNSGSQSSEPSAKRAKTDGPDSSKSSSNLYGRGRAPIAPGPSSAIPAASSSQGGSPASIISVTGSSTTSVSVACVSETQSIPSEDTNISSEPAASPLPELEQSSLSSSNTNELPTSIQNEVVAVPIATATVKIEQSAGNMYRRNR